jgi:hypothetical protein
MDQRQETLNGRGSATGALQSTGTTALAMLWVGLAIYGALAAVVWPPKALAATWTSVIVTLLMTWAVMERKRWGRLAMLGCSWIVCADFAYASFRLATAPPELSRSAIGDGSFFSKIFEAFGCGVPFGLLIFVCCVSSLFWLTRDTVRREFEWRKRAATSGFQLAIAGVFVLGGGFATIVAGVSQDVVGSLHRHRPEITQRRHAVRAQVHVRVALSANGAVGHK